MANCLVSHKGADSLSAYYAEMIKKKRKGIFQEIFLE